MAAFVRSCFLVANYRGNTIFIGRRCYNLSIRQSG